MLIETEYTLLREDFTLKGWEVMINDRTVLIDDETLIVPHEELCIIDANDLQTFLLNDASTTNGFDEAVKNALGNHFGAFEFKGDGEGLGFILDLWIDEESKYKDEPINSFTFWFDDFQD